MHIPSDIKHGQVCNVQKTAENCKDLFEAVHVPWQSISDLSECFEEYLLFFQTCLTFLFLLSK